MNKYNILPFFHEPEHTSLIIKCLILFLLPAPTQEQNWVLYRTQMYHYMKLELFWPLFVLSVWSPRIDLQLSP